MRKEYIYFVDKSNIDKYLPQMPIIKELGDSFDAWLQNHNAQFKSFEEFVDFAITYDNK